jgi:hypothetical protein
MLEEKIIIDLQQMKACIRVPFPYLRARVEAAL